MLVIDIGVPHLEHMLLLVAAADAMTIMIVDIIARARNSANSLLVFFISFASVLKNIYPTVDDRGTQGL